MDNLTLEEKREQFREYFAVKHETNINITPVADGQPIPDVDHLTEHMPYAFRIASDISTIEAKAIRPLRNLSDHASELAEFLNHQSHKIDLIMSYVLRQEDAVDFQFQTLSFGGSGVTVKTDKPLTLGSTHEVKLFLDVEASAVFCFGEVIECEPATNESTCENTAPQYNVSLIFTRIREQDQELLVRASLHIQAQQLRKNRQPTNP
ncbi:PilZ domain-containing protein [Alteromonas sp. a30]|uniref:PilZ domain-containing protein n=1 Tax=Alteromonas sp. a30 TaxID=2730917 RepID=UPI00227E95CA|nr:PilZ domain-containing protein [Alteromonas sp. a30]MCY7294220.1 PilZ domain-containing protein [Alteromonas sp. a30]